MNFNAPFLRPLRILLFPLSLVYGLIIWIRNRMFDKGYFVSSSFNLPLICVGNLSVGGTGKSTMVEYLLTLTRGEFKTAVLSRGYKRKTKGYALANERTTALEIGDEPMQFHLKFPDVAIAVGEERLVAIPQLLQDRPETELIVLDDAFQHRSIKAGLNIVLTSYSNLFTRDWFLPTGELRDEPKSYKRAEIIVVTKCPEVLDLVEKQEITNELKLQKGQDVFFSNIHYADTYHILTKFSKEINAQTEVLVITGIANPEPLLSFLSGKVAKLHQLLFSDHHIFTIDDWREIIGKFEMLESSNKMIVTTEKDAVRLMKFASEIKELPVYVMPIKMEIMFNEKERFEERVKVFVKDFQKKEIING